ncbi:hypothetical protein LZ32DRAFT_611509 [Colletotrichum eremochloae]|nr:hypothetical protein LZ32DRAFT_611509 [Colletotrichum eremochloae]
MIPEYDTAFTSLKYAFSELCLADRSPTADQILTLVRKLKWDAGRVEGNRPAMFDDGVCMATGESMLRVHLNSGLYYLRQASTELERLGLREDKALCEEIIKEI